MSRTGPLSSRRSRPLPEARVTDAVRRSGPARPGDDPGRPGPGGRHRSGGYSGGYEAPDPRAERAELPPRRAGAEADRRRPSWPGTARVDVFRPSEDRDERLPAEYRGLRRFDRPVPPTPAPPAAPGQPGSSPPERVAGDGIPSHDPWRSVSSPLVGLGEHRKPAVGAEPGPPVAGTISGSRRTPVPAASPPPLVTPGAPAGPGPAEPGRRGDGGGIGGWLRQEATFALVLAGVTVGLMLVFQDRWRRGMVVVGVVLVMAALARLVLPARRIGLLAVRGRAFDVSILLLFGVSVIILTFAVPYVGP
ncbi:DUF3017 domain-containing protein [Frankia sp. B2]|uniref:DUF3017 domain-containing protein n=2 Tax=Frankia TaxID=1854 RepID=Q2JF99_FRACC|nr:hypothetical protein Francci3_0659 [Frankia casuarinae]TFE35547.1 DUF3017 domain-containing protein [Frankia sp. B2]